MDTPTMEAGDEIKRLKLLADKQQNRIADLLEQLAAEERSAASYARRLAEREQELNRLYSGAAKGPSDIGLRDLYAAHALAGWVACPETHGTPKEGAAFCFKMADAMLAVRKSKSE